MEFLHETGDNSKDYKLLMAYDGSGRRISKTRLRRDLGASDWAVENVTHYTGIGTEVRETHVNGQDETKVVVNMPNGLGRYQPEDAVDGFNGVGANQRAGYRPPAKFEWYLKNHLGSAMLVYGTSAYNDPFNSGYKGGVKAAYDYRAFGEQVDLTEPTDKVTENFTGKEKDDETELNYFGARYLDPMLGLWISVDPARQFSSPYLYMGNGVNPVNVIDPDGNETIVQLDADNNVNNMVYKGDDNNLVTFINVDGSFFTANEPPLDCYFYSQSLDENGFLNYNIVGQKFDMTMEKNANEMMNDAGFSRVLEWRSGGLLDFKNRYYKGFENSVGVLNGTAMTARDAGNALWGGWMRKYHFSHSMTMVISDFVSDGLTPPNPFAVEDFESAGMQRWGWKNEFGKNYGN